MVSTILFGLGGGISMPALMALAVVKGHDVDAMGSVMGLLTMAHSSGILAGSLIAGAMMDFSRLRHAFPVGAGIMAACVGLFLVFTVGTKADGQPREEE
jgi:MFS transporter, DHA1 family, multidrug resistance protein